MGVTCSQESEKERKIKELEEKIAKLEKEKLEKERQYEFEKRNNRLKEEMERKQKEKKEKEAKEKENLNSKIAKWNYTNNNSNNNNNNKVNNISVFSAKKGNDQMFNFIQDNKLACIIHRNDGMNDFIMEINITKINKKYLHTTAEFIMILDVSGSMSSYVHNLVTKIIPRGLNLLHYNDNDIIHLITFESYVRYSNMTVRQLKNDTSIHGAGGTRMSGVYEKLKNVLTNNKDKKNFRILVLSDGQISDQVETENEASKLKYYLDAYKNDYFLSARSIRYGSGGQQNGDTRAICSILMLNTDTSKSKIFADVYSSDSNESVSQTIYELFKDDYFETDITLESEKMNFRVDPWEVGSKKVKLNEGKNFIFTKKYPKMEDIGIYENGEKVYSRDDFKNGYNLNYSNYNDILGIKIDMTLRKVKINKTSGTKAALEENKKIIEYFEKFEKNLIGNVNNQTIITEKLKTINELDINKFNNNQLAQFIGVDNNNMDITKLLKELLKIDDKDEDDISIAFQNVIKIGDKFDQVMQRFTSYSHD